MAAWLSLIEESDEAERERIAGELRAYCHLDTLAMVEIYRSLAGVVQSKQWLLQADDGALPLNAFE